MFDSRRLLLLSVAACALCLPTLSGARVLPTDLEVLVDANYEPVDADERGLWQSLERLEEAIRTSPQRLQAPELELYTRNVLERLMGRPLPEIRIYLMRDVAFNASMAPSGMMVVNTGFMARARNEAQFAAVLGHEAGHYFRKHSIAHFRDVRRKTSAAAFIGATANAAAGATAMSGHTGAQTWIDVANNINQSLYMSIFQFNRTQEAEADAFGIMLMARSGYAPEAAGELWRQLIAELRASSSQQGKRYKERTSAYSTHPPTSDRMRDLGETAAWLSSHQETKSFEGREEWITVTQPYKAMLLDEQIKLNDPGASLYLLESHAQDGWTGLLKYNEGEVYRMRNAAGDDLKASSAFAASTTFTDAPPEAWREHGYALIKSGSDAEGREALGRYLTLNPGAKDAGIVQFTLAQ